LQGTALTHGSFDVLVQAIRILVHADRCDRAVQWCHKLQADADSDRSPGWYAALGLLCAQALLRLGDLPGAQRAAAEAAAAVQGRGVLLLFGLVAVEVTALTGRGQCAEAARRLELPVPQELFASVHVLDHLRARGLYRLATHGYEAALADFLQAGRLAVRWGLDQPERLPWRTDAATVLLRLGRGMQARRLIDEQLSLPGARAPRAQGTALRLRAATAPPAERPWLLSRAESELRRCGDRLEHARALADLGRALQVSGAGARAGSVLGRAWQLAADCGATALCEEILPGRADRAPARRSRSVVPTGGLTESERRVAAAAALGHTNREIAARLYVTVSTVEQHLTRVYRKLGISRRSELPLDLSDDPDPAPEPA
jgi:DNA-binding CsgD family transcriptional regulator